VRPLSAEELVDLDRYAGLRDAYRAAVIAHKRSRRVSVGEKVTLVFEDRETLRFQVQEMLWVERIRSPRAVQHELDVYNELMPGAHELSATLFIEITERERIREELDRLIGIDEHVCLVMGEGEREERIPARFDPKQMEEERIAAVHYVRFALEEPQVERFADLRCPLRLRIDHPSYRRETPLAPETRASLLGDLCGEPEALLTPDGCIAAGRG